MALRDKEAIAEKLNGYADKLAGAAILQSLSFAFAFQNKDFRDLVYRAGGGRAHFWIGTAFAFYAVVIALCTVGEIKLLVDPEPSTPESRWAWYIRFGRFGIVFISYFISWYALAMMF